MHLTNTNPDSVLDKYLSPRPTELPPAPSVAPPEESQYARGGNGIFGDGMTGQQKTAQQKYQDELRIQVISFASFIMLFRIFLMDKMPTLVSTTLSGLYSYNDPARMMHICWVCVFIQLISFMHMLF